LEFIEIENISMIKNLIMFSYKYLHKNKRKSLKNKYTIKNLKACANQWVIFLGDNLLCPTLTSWMDEHSFPNKIIKRQFFLGGNVLLNYGDDK
jgi:hypothetical protein